MSARDDAAGRHDPEHPETRTGGRPAGDELVERYRAVARTRSVAGRFWAGRSDIADAAHELRQQLGALACSRSPRDRQAGAELAAAAVAALRDLAGRGAAVRGLGDSAAQADEAAGALLDEVRARRDRLRGASGGGA